MLGSLRRLKNILTREVRWERYLLHAVGEIILIVIGLLIALSLDDAAEGRKWRKKEKTFLADFQSALRLEIKDLEDNEAAIIDWSKSIHIIDTFLRSEQGYPDSLDRHFSNLANFVFFIPTSRPKFEELKSIGFDLITDAEIRQMIVAYFELHVPYITEFEQQADLLREDLRQYYLDHFDGWAYRGARPEDLEFLRKDKRFRHLLAQQEYIWENLRIVYANIAVRARELHERICQRMDIC